MQTNKSLSSMGFDLGTLSTVVQCLTLTVTDASDSYVGNKAI